MCSDDSSPRPPSTDGIKQRLNRNLSRSTPRELHTEQSLAFRLRFSKSSGRNWSSLHRKHAGPGPTASQLDTVAVRHITNHHSQSAPSTHLISSSLADKLALLHNFPSLPTSAFLVLVLSSKRADLRLYKHSYPHMTPPCCCL